MVRFLWPTRYLDPPFTYYMLQFQWIKLLYVYIYGSDKMWRIGHVVFVRVVIKADQIAIRYLLFVFVCVC